MPRRNQNKAPKDLKAPKKPNSGYIIFSKQRMPALRAENEGKRASDLAKIIGAEWKAMTDEEKLPYLTESREQKEKFVIAMTEYKKSDDYAEFQASLRKWKDTQKSAPRIDADENDGRPAVLAKASKRPKDPHAPKKPMTAFFLYQQSRRPRLKEEQPALPGKELVKRMAEEWRAMAAEQKEPFETQAREKKAAYTATLEAYKQSDDYRKHQAVVAAWQAEQKQIAQNMKRKKQAAPVHAPPVARRVDTETESETDSDSSSYESSSETPPREKAVEANPSSRNFEGSSSDSSGDEDDDVEMVEQAAVDLPAVKVGGTGVEGTDGDDEKSVSENADGGVAESEDMEE